MNHRRDHLSQMPPLPPTLEKRWSATPDKEFSIADHYQQKGMDTQSIILQPLAHFERIDPLDANHLASIFSSFPGLPTTEG